MHDAHRVVAAAVRTRRSVRYKLKICGQVTQGSDWSAISKHFVGESGHEHRAPDLNTEAHPEGPAILFHVPIVMVKVAAARAIYLHMADLRSTM